jgi:hypothetical protein
VFCGGGGWVLGGGSRCSAAAAGFLGGGGSGSAAAVGLVVGGGSGSAVAVGLIIGSGGNRISRQRQGFCRRRRKTTWM